MLVAFDLETTGLNTETDEIIELGYALYDLQNPAPLLMRSHLVVPKVPVNEEVTKITGIDNQMIQEYGETLDYVLRELFDIIVKYRATYYVAHNGLDYDIPMLKNHFSRAGVQYPNLKVIDTKVDLPLAYTPKSTSLVYMAADHGFINPFPHRALTDAMTCMRLLKQYDILKVIAITNTPMLEIRADVNYDRRELAKKAGFNWDAERKIWVKKVREYYLKELKEKCQFPLINLTR